MIGKVNQKYEIKSIFFNHSNKIKYYDNANDLLVMSRKRFLMPQNLTKKTIKKPQKSLNKSFKTHSTKKYLLNLNDF